MMSGYFSPIDVDGLQRYSGAAGAWYRFDLPEANATPLGILPITVPTEATGVLVQGITGLVYSFSPVQADLDPSSALTLPATGSVFVPGRTGLAQLCIYVPALATDIVFQFYKGSIGPIPIIR